MTTSADPTPPAAQPPGGSLQRADDGPALHDSPAARLGVVELLDRDGHARWVHPVERWPVRIGRAVDNDLILDDLHVAAHHAELAPGPDGAVLLCALPSLNGVQLGRRRLAAGDRQAPGSQAWTLGTTRLRLRLAADPVDAERALSSAPAALHTGLYAALLWLWLLARHALELDPGASFSEWLSPLLSAPAMVAGWCLAWALVSKLFLHRFDFMPHLALVVRLLLLIVLVSSLLPLLAASTGWAWLSRIADSVQVVLALVLLTRQTLLVLPAQRRPVVIAAGAAWVFGSATLLALNQQRADRWFEELYVSTLPLPALLWAPVVPVDRFVEEIAGLEKRVSAAVRDAASAAQGGTEADEE